MEYQYNDKYIEFEDTTITLRRKRPKEREHHVKHLRDLCRHKTKEREKKLMKRIYDSFKEHGRNGRI